MIVYYLIYIKRIVDLINRYLRLNAELKVITVDNLQMGKTAQVNVCYDELEPYTGGEGEICNRYNTCKYGLSCKLPDSICVKSKNVEQLMTEAGLEYLYVIIKDDLEKLGKDFEELYEEEEQTTLQGILDLIEGEGDKTKFKNFVQEIYEMD